MVCRIRVRVSACALQLRETHVEFALCRANNGEMWCANVCRALILISEVPGAPLPCSCETLAAVCSLIMKDVFINDFSLLFCTATCFFTELYISNSTEWRNSHCEVLGFEKHTFSNRYALLSNVFMSFSSGKYRTNNAKTKQHQNVYACAKDRVAQTTDAHVRKGATSRVNIDKEGAGGVKKTKKLQVTWC